MFGIEETCSAGVVSLLRFGGRGWSRLVEVAGGGRDGEFRSREEIRIVANASLQ